MGDNRPFANKMLVMVDGRSIYVDAQGNVFWRLLPITLPEIKRIEVLKEPASATYGLNAFDGIVPITTKTPDEMRGATLQFGGGEVGTLSGAAVYPLTNTILQLAPLSGMGPLSQTVGSYNLLKFRLGYRFWTEKAPAGYMHHLEIARSVFNALNDSHREHPLSDILGTRVMGWLTVKR